MTPATANKTIEHARSFVGYTETPPGSNRTRFGREYGMDGVPWCAMFVWSILTDMRVEIIKSAYTPTMAQWFKDNRIGFTDDSKIEPGDILFFDFPDSLHRIQHVGFATGKLVGGRVATIEGNTSAGSAGSQDNGGGVFSRSRGAAEIVYIGRPAYSEREKLPRFDLPKSRTWIGRGDTGADVITWQRDLNRWMRYLRHNRKRLTFDFGRIDDDGRFDAETVKATMTFQRQHRDLDVDGRVGRATERKMEKVRARQKAA